jgi:hypothetical protein
MHAAGVGKKLENKTSFFAKATWMHARVGKCLLHEGTLWFLLSTHQATQRGVHLNKAYLGESWLA